MGIIKKLLIFGFAFAACKGFDAFAEIKLSEAKNSGIQTSESQTSQEIRIFSYSMRYFSGTYGKDGTSQVGVLFSPDIPSSKKEAEEYAAQMNASEHARKSKLTAKLLSISDLGKGGVNAAYISRKLANYYDSIIPTAKESHIFVFSNDADCVSDRLCILSINTDYGVDIHLNEETMRAFGFDVDPAFKFLVRRF